MKTCDRCGKDFKLFQYSFYTTKSGKQFILCDECRKIVEKSKDQEKEITGGRSKKEKIIFKENLAQDNLSISELQLRELIQIKKDILRVKNDVHTISTIVLIWFIFGLISLIVTIVSFRSIIP